MRKEKQHSKRIFICYEGLKCREQNQDLEAKVYETLQSQVCVSVLF